MFIWGHIPGWLLKKKENQLNSTDELNSLQFCVLKRLGWVLGFCIFNNYPGGFGDQACVGTIGKTGFSIVTPDS